MWQIRQRLLYSTDTCANQSVIGIIENKNIPSEYIYLWIKHKIIGLISHQTGGAQQHINKNNVNELDILLPDDSLILKFKEVMKPIFKNISINCFEFQNLSQIRDSLLPRLMSGRIRVPVEVRAWHF
jgi:type I restriction enzyme S subunit